MRKPYACCRFDGWCNPTQGMLRARANRKAVRTRRGTHQGLSGGAAHACRVRRAVAPLCAPLLRGGRPPPRRGAEGARAGAAEDGLARVRVCAFVS